MSSHILLSDKAIQRRIEASRTRIVKAVLPCTTNHHGTLASGHALSWMGETAFITATRFARKRLVTVSSDHITFTYQISVGSIVELISEVVHMEGTRLSVQVSVYIEDMYQDGIEKAIEGVFSFITIDIHKKPVSILDGLI